jgi:soluble lytic murein transglycosylase-like protein
MPRSACIVAAVLAFTWSGLVLACWNEASARYQINPELLYAIAKCESGLHLNVVTRSLRKRTGMYDIGLMQINSSHLRRLEAYGINEAQLYNACTNIQVGAWILAGEFQKHGFSWDAVGAYNAACTERKGKDCAAARSKYAWCVYRNLPPQSAPGLSKAHSSLRASTALVTPIIATAVVR